MLNDTLTTVSWRARPRSFVALMSLYESNYIRFGWLAGDVTALSGAYRSVVAGDCELLLSVVGRSPYTTMLRLTYLLPEAAGSSVYPDMGVRLYHDARLAEAQEWAPAHASPVHGGAVTCGLHGIAASGGTACVPHGAGAQPAAAAVQHGAAGRGGSAAGARSLRSRMERELDQRWARNVMLNKWLEYCVERGHRFSPATRTR